MKHIYPLLLLSFFLLTSCGSHKKVAGYTSSRRVSSDKAVVNYAKSFLGTPYKYGGTTKAGMDCSGLIYTAYKKQGVTLPRISREMAKKGKTVSLKQVAQGDLLFFKTNKNKNTINHVGLVVANKNGIIRFIHATTSRGVIISNLSESYWHKAFVQAKRLP